MRLAAFHEGKGRRYLPLRDGPVRVGARECPHPEAVPGLLAGPFVRLGALWAECRAREQDLLVAVFAAYGITAIHPFSEGNGRTAVSTMNYLLMHRWALSRPALMLPSQGHRWLGGLFCPLDDAFESTPAGFAKMHRELASRFVTATRPALEATPAFVAGARWLEAGVTAAPPHRSQP